MTPLDAAKAMAAYDPRDGDIDGCVHCSHYEHEPDCPVLMLPQIVAALEAAEHVILSCLGRHDYGGESFRVDEVAINDLRAALLPPSTP